MPPFPHAAFVMAQKAELVTIGVALDFAAGLSLQPTTMCEVQYSGQCCGNSSFPAPAGPVLGRVCTAIHASACTATNGRQVVLANVTVNATANRLVFTAQLGNASDRARWIDFSLTDFPQCSVHNREGLALGPFGPLAVWAAEPK